MGTITLRVEGTTVGTVADGKGIEVVTELSESDSFRILAYLAREQGKVPDGTVPIDTVGPHIRSMRGMIQDGPGWRDRTPTELVTSWWEQQVDVVKTRAIQYEIEAARAKIVNPPPINATTAVKKGV